MSDTVGPGHDNPLAPEGATPDSKCSPDDDGGERPKVEFDVPLAETSANGRLQASDSVDSLTGDVPVDYKKPQRNRNKLLAALTSVAVLGGGYVASRTMTGNGPASEEPLRTAPDFEVPKDNPNATGEAGAGRGNIDLTRIVGRDYITATRPNGQEIKVPRLGGRTPSEIASSALALFACYQTTASDECKAAFSTDARVQALLEEFRDKEIEHVLRVPGNADMQLAIYDDSRDPAVFTSRPASSSGQTIIDFTGGTLHMGRYIDPTGTNEWQGPETRATGGLESTVTSMVFHLKQTGQGLPSIERFEYNIT